MKSAAVLGLDAGTTNLKLLALDRRGAVIARVACGYGVDAGPEGKVTQDPRRWIEAIEAGMAALRERCDLSGVRAIGLSAQGETLVCCDAAGAWLAPAMSWMDTRAGAEARELAAARDDWHARTGKAVAAYSTLAKIQWLRRHEPALYERASRFCQVADFLAAFLTGRWVLDTSNASFTSCFDIRRRQWDSGLVNQFGLAGRLPEVAESGTVAGPLLPRLARQWGLPDGVQVVLGGHDQGCAAIGTAPPADAVVLSTGTAWVLYSASAEPRLDPQARAITYCHPEPGRWAVLAAYSGGAALDAFAARFAPGAGGFAALEKEENLCPDLIALPYFFGANSPENDQTARAALFNLGPHHGPGHVFMALMEAIAFETRRNLEVFRQMGLECNRLRMVGGAARSRLWPQLVADASGLAVDVLLEPDTAPLGAGFLAGQAAGLWATKNPPQTIEFSTLQPEPARATRLAGKFQAYLRAASAERARRAAEPRTRQP